MLALAFLQWWYGPGWTNNFTSLKPRLKHTYASFSVPQLLRTLFSPWRRIITPGGGTIGDRFRAMIDNALSRIIGAIVRLMTILGALIIMFFLLIGSVIFGIIWPLLPLIGVGLIIAGII